MKKAAFLDRDGTLIRDVGYISRPEDVELVPGVVPALRGLISLEFLLVVVTNQSGIGRWRITKPQYDAVHRRMADLLAVHDISIDKTYYCPHTPEMGCNCRKPKCGMFYRAATELDIDLRASIMFGDKESDMVPCVGRCIRIPKDGPWEGLAALMATAPLPAPR